MKKLKRVASATVLATMVMTGIVPTLATDTQTSTNPYIEPAIEPTLPEGTLTKEEAIAKVKTMFATEIGSLKLVNASYDELPSNGVPSWEVAFSNYALGESRNTSKPLDRIEVSIDAKTGVLLQFHHLNPAWHGDKYPYEDVAEAATDRFLDLYAPTYHKDFKSDGVKGSTKAYNGGEDGKQQVWSASTVIYTEEVNGIPFLQNALQFEVDQYGNVTDFYASTACDVTKLPAPDQVLSLENAKSLYAQAYPMSKVYESPFYSAETGSPLPEATLMYAPPGSFKMIDAFTGQPVVQSYTFNYDLPVHQEVSLSSNGDWIPKGKAEITKLVGQIEQLDLSDYELREMNQPDAATWEFIWHKQDNANKRDLSVRARFDAKSGQMLSLDRFGFDQTDKGNFTITEGQQKAEAFLQKVLPSGQQDLMLVGQVDTTAMSKPPAWYQPGPETQVDHMGQNFYAYHFCYTHQGVPIIDQPIDVKIDRESGEVLSLYTTPKTDAKLPDNTGTITPEAATAAFLNDHRLHLQYEWDRYFDHYAPQGELVYVPDYETVPSTYVDAFTGKTVEFKLQ